ncbi:BCCT family transporter (plasmid) [Haloferax prahovense]|uniref:BCCT family transporter n=1 Tax=Haloferax prahovense TaxID=381852 RepID=UPI003C764CED
MTGSPIRDEIANLYDEIDTPVFAIGVFLTGVLVSALAFYPKASSTVIRNVNEVITTNLSWYFQALIFALVIFFLFVMISPWGEIKLGKPDEPPEFSYGSYIMMVFAATFGAGIVFWGAAETLSHYETVPPLVNAQPQSIGAMIGAMQYTMFHWGISPWVNHMILSVPLAYYVHRKDAPMKPSSVFVPILGVNNLDKTWLKVIDIIAVVAAAGGATVTVGLAAQQFITGLSYNYGVSVGDFGIIALVTGLTVGYTASAVLGIEKGIKRVSTFNVVLFLFILVCILVFSPFASIFNLGTAGMGKYITNFVDMSLYVNVGGGQSWVGSWTVFYWAWWISFAPMTGIFIARISRGRTLKQVIFGAMVGGTAATLPWFVTMGGYSMLLQHSGQVDLLSIIDSYGISVATYPILAQLPFGELFVVLFLLLVFTFLITTIDSATISLAILTTSGGTQHPSIANRFVWGAIIGLLTSLLLVIGGVGILQNFTIIAGLPMALLALVTVVGFAYQLEESRPVLLTREEDRGSSNVLVNWVSSAKQSQSNSDKSTDND